MRFFLHKPMKGIILFSGCFMLSAVWSCTESKPPSLSSHIGKRRLTVWTGHTFENHQRRPAFPYSHTNKNEFISVSIQKNFNLIIETWGEKCPWSFYFLSANNWKEVLSSNRTWKRPMSATSNYCISENIRGKCNPTKLPNETIHRCVSIWKYILFH